MFLYEIAIQNKELLKLLFTIIVGLICFAIVLKTDRLFRLSYHQGIRYFRNAFFFYGLAFIFRYLFGVIYSPVMKIIFEFFIVSAGFFLLYSLIWKRFEPSNKFAHSSLFNLRIFLFYCLTAILVFLDYIWASYCFMFVSQIILFGVASIISYKNYIKKKQSLSKLYFLVLVLNLIDWLSNFIVAVFLEWYQPIVIGVYFLNIIIFFIFLYGVISATKNN